MAHNKLLETKRNTILQEFKMNTIVAMRLRSSDLHHRNHLGQEGPSKRATVSLSVPLHERKRLRSMPEARFLRSSVLQLVACHEQMSACPQGCPWTE
jgi:hypothetical protein